MLTITPTAVLESNPGDELEVFAVIEGKKVYLPPEANYVMQDKRGIWYYSARKPRPKENDWTPNKTSIACRHEGGYVRALITPTKSPWLETWCPDHAHQIPLAGDLPAHGADGVRRPGRSQAARRRLAPGPSCPGGRPAVMAGLRAPRSGPIRTRGSTLRRGSHSCMHLQSRRLPTTPFSP